MSGQRHLYASYYQEGDWVPGESDSMGAQSHQDPPSQGSYPMQRGVPGDYMNSNPNSSFDQSVRHTEYYPKQIAGHTQSAFTLTGDQAPTFSRHDLLRSYPSMAGIDPDAGLTSHPTFTASEVTGNAAQSVGDQSDLKLRRRLYDEKYLEKRKKSVLERTGLAYMSKSEYQHRPDLHIKYSPETWTKALCTAKESKKFKKTIQSEKLYHKFEDQVLGPKDSYIVLTLHYERVWKRFRDETYDVSKPKGSHTIKERVSRLKLSQYAIPWFQEGIGSLANCPEQVDHCADWSIQEILDFKPVLRLAEPFTEESFAKYLRAHVQRIPEDTIEGFTFQLRPAQIDWEQYRQTAGTEAATSENDTATAGPSGTQSGHDSL